MKGIWDLYRKRNALQGKVLIEWGCNKGSKMTWGLRLRTLGN